LDEIAYKKILAQNGGRWPYGVREGGFLIVFVSFLYFFIIAVNAIVKPDRFYRWLLLLIAFPWIVACMFNE